MGRYRNRLEIIADVLSIVKGGAKKTQIMYQANLSYRLLLQYLRDVVEAGLVKLGSENSFRLTDKGLAFLRRFNSYDERRQELEEQLRGVMDEKVRLENMFLNTERMTDDSRNCRSEKDEIRKKAV